MENQVKQLIKSEVESMTNDDFLVKQDDGYLQIESFIDIGGLRVHYCAQVVDIEDEGFYVLESLWELEIELTLVEALDEDNVTDKERDFINDEFMRLYGELYTW